MMKKILSIILISVMLLSLFIINTWAENNEDFTLEEAEELFHEAFNRLYIVVDLFDDNEDPYFSGTQPELVGKLYDNGPYVICKKAPDGKPYPYYNESSGRFEGLIEIELWYRIITDERFDTLEKCSAYIKEVFTDEMADAIIKDNPHVWMVEEDVPCFRKAGDDFYIKGELPEGVTVTPDTMLYLTDNFVGQFRAFFKSANKLTIDGDTAIMDITCLGPGYGLVSTDIPATVTFKKTENGWRVSGGSYVDYLTNKIRLSEIVNTSDNTPLYIAAIALVSLAAPVVMKRRRREF